MRKREPWQHEWASGGLWSPKSKGVIKACRRNGCQWEMLSRANSNRYRNGPNGAWQHSPKDCKGEQG